MSMNSNGVPESGKPIDLDLRLAVVSSCTNKHCQVVYLDDGAFISANISEPMIKHNVRVQAGQLVAVDCSTTPPRIVFRMEEIEVLKKVGGYTLSKDENPVDAEDLCDEFFPMIRARYAQSEEIQQSLNWIDVSSLSFNTLLLLERIQLSWFPGWLPETELSIALRANPVVEWYMRHKCPELNDWLDGVMAKVGESQIEESEQIRQAEEAIMASITDLLTYVVAPAAYDAQPFLAWDDQELVSLVDFTGKTVIDIGSGTGRLALITAEKVAAVYAVEPITRLREFIKDKAMQQGLRNVYAVDGLITDLPFSDRFADVTMGGHVFGDQPEEEYGEMARVTKPGGMIILCPGGTDRDEDRHRFLISQGFQWSQFEEPGGPVVRKYWKRV